MAASILLYIMPIPLYYSINFVILKSCFSFFLILLYTITSQQANAGSISAIVAEPFLQWIIVPKREPSRIYSGQLPVITVCSAQLPHIYHQWDESFVPNHSSGSRCSYPKIIILPIRKASCIFHTFPSHAFQLLRTTSLLCRGKFL